MRGTYRLSLVLALGSFGFGAGAQAHSFINDLVSPEVTVDQDAGRDCGCTFFGGHWTGSCTVNGKKQNLAATIDVAQTSCQRVSINGEPLAVGGEATSSLTIAPDLCLDAQASRKPASTDAGQSSADWNQDKTVLTVTSHGVTRRIGGPKNWALAVASIHMKDSHLLIDGTVDSDGGKKAFNCSFDK